jgi:cyclic pyranopterin monophosphate synthase
VCRDAREAEKGLHLLSTWRRYAELVGEACEPLHRGHAHRLDATGRRLRGARLGAAGSLSYAGMARHDRNGKGDGDDSFPDFPHLDQRGNARMVDVTGKTPTHRRALARGRVTMLPDTVRRVVSGDTARGDVLGTARTAGILAAKATSDLLPLCHPLLLGAITVDFDVGEDFVEVIGGVEALDRTGVEMEALTACSVAALTIYAACKSLDRTMVVDQVAVWEKAGGRSGSWVLGADGSVHHTPTTGEPDRR